MQLQARQQGMSTVGWLVSATLVLFFITCLVKLAPEYMEAMTVKSVINSALERGAYKGKGGAEAIRAELEKNFNTNQVDAIRSRDIQISRDKEKGGYIIDASYERRVPLIYNIDVVLKFDDMVFNTRTEAE